MKLDVIAFDADDTLWVNEPRYIAAEARLRELLSPYADGEAVAHDLHATEIRNLTSFGYGVKAYTFSMIETAIALSNGHISGTEIDGILQVGRRMMQAPVEVFEHVEPTLAKLSPQRDLMILTKGDLVEQGDRIARSGLAKYFRYIEIVREKTVESYRGLLQQRRIDPQRFLMVGNSMKSDILPVLELGAYAVYIHYDGTWEHEKAQIPDRLPTTYKEIKHIGVLPDLIETIEGG